MNVDDLRSVLRERADAVTDQNAEHRAARVRARVRAAHRRRIAGVAVLTAGVLAVVGTVSFLPNRAAPPADPGPADLPAAPTIQHERFLSHSGEFDLIAAEVGEPGQNTLELAVPAHDGEVMVSMVCFGPSGPAEGYWVSGYVGDDRPDRPDSAWCGDDPDTPAVPGVFGQAPGPWDYIESLTVQPEDDQRTVHVELTQEVDENGDLLDRADEIGTYVPVSHPGAVLGVAVYTIADPVTTVADAEIRALVGVNGRDYVYREHRVSEPGERTLTWTLEPSTEERYYDVVFTDAIAPDMLGPTAVAASLDGESCRVSYVFARLRAGGCLLTPGEPHTITVTIEHDPPTGAVLGIVVYDRTR